MKIHETTKADGTLAPSFLEVEGGVLALISEEGAFVLPDGAVEAVMTRFGKALETSERVAHVAVLDLGNGCALRHVRHRSVYDVIARDYLVYEASGREPLCALATTVAGALGHLGRVAKNARR